jgi:hypothetical protein
MTRNRFLALAGLVLALGLVAGPADASRQDSWLGSPFMWHLPDVIAYPHRAIQPGWQNQATAIFVPQYSSTATDPLDNTGSVQGTATIGRDNWALILAANDNRGFNPVKTIGSGSNPVIGFYGRSPAAWLDMNAFSAPLTLGLDTGVSVDTRMQLGFAYGLEAVDLGIFWTMAGGENTFENATTGNPTVKLGAESSYNTIGASANLNTLGAFRSFEISAAFGFGDHEEFGDTTGANDAGTGDHSSVGVNLQMHLDREWVGWVPALNATFGTCSSDWKPAENNNSAELDWTYDQFRIDIGGVKEFADGSRMALNLGLVNDSVEYKEKDPTDGTLFFKEEDSVLTFPTCGAAGEWWVKPWWGLDVGAAAYYFGAEEKDDNAGDGSDVDTFNDAELVTAFGFGTTFRIARETWNADLSFNLNNDILSNPGAIINGRNNAEESPVAAVELLVGW